MKRVFAVALLALSLGAAAYGQTVQARSAQAVQNDKALAFAMLAECEKVLGRDGKGFDELVKLVNAVDPRFNKGLVYVTVGGFDGTMFAHPVPALQGLKFPLDLPDADGRPMQMVSTAKDKGRGEIEYRFNDSAIKKVVRKWAIVSKIPARDAYISISVNLEE